MVSTETVTETVVLIVVPPLQAIQLSDHIIEHGSFVSDPFPALSDALVVLLVLAFSLVLLIGAIGVFFRVLPVGSAWDATGRPIDKSDDATRPVARGARQQAGHALGAGRPEHRLLGLVRRRPGAAACPDI